MLSTAFDLVVQLVEASRRVGPRTTAPPLSMPSARSAGYWIDRRLVDGLVNFCGQVPPAVGKLMRKTQMGLVPFYALVMVLGTLIVLTVKLLLAQGS